MGKDNVIKKKDTLYFARIVPNANIYDVYKMKVRTVENDWFVGMDKRDKHAYLFSYSDIDKTVFKDRKDALNKVKEAEKNKRAISEESYYEEY